MRAVYVLACVAAFMIERSTSAADAADFIIKAPQAPAAYDWSGFYVGGHRRLRRRSSAWTAPIPPAAHRAAHSTSITGSTCSRAPAAFSPDFRAATISCCRPASLFGVEADASFPNTLAGTATATSASAGTASFQRHRAAFWHSARPRRLRVRSLARLRHRRLRLELRSAHTHAGRRRRARSGTAKRRCCGGSAGPQAPASSCRSRRTGVRGSNICSAISAVAAGRSRRRRNGFASDLTLQQVRFGLDYAVLDGGTALRPTPQRRCRSDRRRNLERPRPDHLRRAICAAVPRALYAARTASPPIPDARPSTPPPISACGCGRARKLWINPEIDQGFGLSGTLGVAGFPSGEAYKVGADYPYARLHRAFIRQTIDLGGETQKVDAGINQFAGSQTADRLVSRSENSASPTSSTPTNMRTIRATIS